MRYVSFLFALLAVAAFSLAMIGCSEPPQPSPATNAAPAAQHSHDEAGEEHAGHEHAAAEQQGEHAAAEEPGEQAGPLAELSEEDRALVEKQKVCPVSGQPLGAMGVPVKVTVKDRDVFLCCEGCKASLLKDPDKYLAKLDSAE